MAFAMTIGLLFLNLPVLADTAWDRAANPIDTLLLIDSSASMRLSDPQQLRQTAVATFAAALGPNDRLALAEFSDGARLLAPFQAPKNSPELAEKIASLDDSGEYTDILSAIELGERLFREGGRQGVKKMLVLLSDGRMDPNPQRYSQAEATNKLMSSELPELKRNGIVVHTVALSDEADRNLMSRMALSTDGLGKYAKDASSISPILADFLAVTKQSGKRDFFSRTIEIGEELPEVTIYIRRTLGAEVTIRSPSGKVIKSGERDVSNSEWFENDEFSLISLKEPELGDWIVEGLRDPDEFIVTLRDLRAKIHWPSALFVGSRGVIEAVLLDGSRPVSIPALSKAMRATVQLHSIDRIADPVVSGEMLDDGSGGDGIANDGAFSREAVVEKEGQYKALVTLRGPTFERSAEQPFQVSRVLMRAHVDFIEQPFSTLVEGYKNKDGLARKHQAYGSHGAGGVTVGDETKQDESAKGVDEDDSKRQPSGESSEVDNEQGEEGGPSAREVTPKANLKSPVLRVELESEVLSFRKHEVNAVILDQSGTEYPLDLYPSKKTRLTLYGNLSDTPRLGKYQVQARLRVKPKWGSERLYLGPWLPFESFEVPLRGEKSPTKQKTQSEVGPALPVFMVIVVNAFLGIILFFMLKSRIEGRGDHGNSVIALSPDFEPIILRLERIAAESEVSLDDVRFIDQNLLSSRSFQRESSNGVTPEPSSDESTVS